MSLRLPNSVFVHIPRTGGLWLAEVTSQLGIKRQQFKGDVDSHFTYQQLPDYWRQFPGFSFVRHPYKWLRSRWSHCIEHNLVADYRNYGVHRLFDDCVRDTFEETVRTIIDVRPGIVGFTYRTMTLGISPDLIYRTEDLPLAAYNVLHKLEGLAYNFNDVIAQMPPINGTSTMDKYKAEMDELPESLLNEFLETERVALRIWEDAQCNL